MTRPAPSLRRLATAATLALAAVLATQEATAAVPPASEPAPPAAIPEAPTLDDATAVDIDRRFNELRREVLDDRARDVDWWLEATAIFLTLFAVVVAIAGFVSFKRFREIEVDARQSVKDAKRSSETAAEHAATARNLIEEIRAKRDEADLLLKGTTAKRVAEDPAEAGKVVKSVRETPAAPAMDRAIAAAILLHRQGNIEGATEKWRAIAEVAEGGDDELAARAWFSVGYLHHESGKPQEAMDAYGRALRLKPDMTNAWYNRGNARSALDRREDAIADYDEALRLKPDYAEAWNNRGAIKNELGRHEEAIADYDEALRLKPDYARAYANRARAKLGTGRRDAARQDFEAALARARKAGDEALADGMESELKKLHGGEGS